jgi:hypothetical protein
MPKCCAAAARSVMAISKDYRQSIMHIYLRNVIQEYDNETHETIERVYA